MTTQLQLINIIIIIIIIIITKTGTDIEQHVLMFANSAQGRSIHRMRIIRYIAKTATDTVLIKTTETITTMFARKFINAKAAIKLKRTHVRLYTLSQL